MAKGWFSPWQYETADYLNRRVAISITFNETTLAITNPGMTGTRDAGCLYDRVLIGEPGAGMKVFLIPEGAFSVGRAQLANQGFSTIDQVAHAGFTLGTTETPT